MIKLSLLLIVLSISSLSIAQDNGDLENQFYFRFGLSNPTKSYFGAEDSFWDNRKRVGGVFELGSIFMINNLPLSDGLRLGVNVDYAEFSYHQLSSKIDDAAIGIFKISSKIGPSISYSPVSNLVFDAYVKFKIAWVAGMANAAADGTVDEDDTYGGTLGMGYAVGVNVRYRFLMLSFEFNKDKMKLERTDTSGSYLGNAKDQGDETPMPSYNLTLGFCF